VSNPTPHLVQKLWNYCIILRDDGLSYGDYVEQLTFLLFLKMADEQSRPPFNKPSPIPKGKDWPALLAQVARRLSAAEELASVVSATLLQARRPEDEGSDLWSATNVLQEHLTRGGISDQRRDRHGKLRSVRPLRGIDSKVNLNKGLWGLAERIANRLGSCQRARRGLWVAERL